MSFTPKQERNGATGTTDTRDSATPGPDDSPVVAAQIGKAVAVADERKGETAALLNGPAEIGGSQIIGANGNMWDWESGLAIAESGGEA